MTEVELRIPWGMGQTIKDTVYRRGSHEYVVFALVSHGVLGGKDVLLVHEVITLAEDAYLDDSGGGASWSGSSMFEIVSKAMDKGLGIILLHAHQHVGPPSLSSVDLQSAKRLLPFFVARVPGRPHGSIVFSRDFAGGVVQFPGEKVSRTRISVRWIGPAINTWRATETPVQHLAGRYHRQVLAIGSEGQKRIRRARVVVVGLSGGGSHVVHQLALMGVGEVIGIDPQRLEWSNHHRAVGLTRWDFILRRKKVDAFRRMVRRMGSETRFIGISRAVPHPDSLSYLKSADIIVGCLDNLHARADLQEIAARYLIPYIDIGVNIRTAERRGEAASLTSTVGGNVLTFIPGAFCLWCCDFLSKEKLEQELAGPNRSYFVGTNAPEAQVVSFNGSVASQAVNEVLQLLTGYSPRNLLLDGNVGTLLRGYKKFDGSSGTLEEWGGKKNPVCPCCVASLGLGDPVWTTQAK